MADPVSLTPVSLTIDGAEVTCQPGQMVLEAANQAGVYVPYLCYHPGMKPFAACRMCVVEVEGGRGLPASCTLPVQEGMVVRTDTPGVRAVRKEIMEMLTAEHPHGCLTCHRVDLCGPQDVCLRHVAVNDRCVTCPKNERCELKDTTRYVGVPIESPLDYKYRDLPIHTADPFYDRDYNLCIVCGRCVRACDEIRGDNAITFVERAGKALVGTSHGTSLLESGCEFCGACLDVCPVGALVERDHKWEKAARVVRAICPHCPVGCQLNLEINSKGNLIRSIPELHSPANRGQACFRGKFGLEYVNHRQRLRTPLVRRDGELVEATWDEALDLITNRLRTCDGPSFALLSSGDSTNEEHYLAQKFARVAMGSNNVDMTCNDHPEIADTMLAALGIAAATGSVWDLEQSDCVLVFAANITEEHNVVALPIKKAIKSGAKLIVVDPREVELTRFASANLHPVPGTELLLLGGLLKAVVDGGLAQDRWQWLATHCEDPGALLATAHAVDADIVVQETGIPWTAIEAAARTFSQTDKAAIIFSLDNMSPALSTGCIQVLINLALFTSNLGSEGTGLYPLRAGANVQGGWDIGCVPHMLPGYQSVSDDDARDRSQQLWGSPLPSQEGVPLRDLPQNIRSGDIKALMVIGEPPNFLSGLSPLSEDDGEALVQPEFLVVQDAFLGEVASRADVVLPRVVFAEKTGTYTNMERRVQLLQPAMDTPSSDPGDGPRPESWVLSQLAQRLGVAGFGHQGISQVMDEIAAATPFYGGVSHLRLLKEGRWVARNDPSSPGPTQVLYSDKEYLGLQWPCPSADQPGTGVLFTDEEWRASVASIDFIKETPPRSEAFPLLLVPGRVLLQTERDIEIEEGRQNSIAREELVSVSQADAEALGIEDGDSIEVVTASVRMSAHAQVREETPQGVLNHTALFGQLMTEVQASDNPRAVAAAPGLHIVPARIEKLADGGETG